MRIGALLLVGMMGFALATGCEYDAYELTLEPADDGSLQRTLAIRRSVLGADAAPGAPPPLADVGHRPAPLDAAVLAAIAERYGQAPPAQPAFSGRFTNEMPAEMGGHGRYLHLDSPLGSASIYAERFGPATDALTVVDNARAAGDTLAELLETWLARELADADGWPALRDTLRGSLRHDLVNLGLLFWKSAPDDIAIDIDAADRWHHAFGGRLALHLVERGYVRPGDLPPLFRLLDRVSHNDTTDDEQALAPLARLVARQMDIDDGAPLPAELAFLTSEASLHRSWQQFVASGQAQRFELGDDPGATLAGHIARLTGQGVFRAGMPDALHLHLAIDEPPVVTNGRWDATRGGVAWAAWLREGPSLPRLAYAIWTEPNEAVQRERLGRVALRGQSLLHWVVYYNALAPDTRQQWRDALAGLDPAAPPAAQLEAVDTGHPADDARLREWLLEALGEVD
ncbi:MAG: hypothetical protein WD316_05025 [Phycisphaeraceae bacterium]